MEHTVTMRLINRRSREINFYLEPWGDAYAMPPGGVFEVVARGPTDDTLEVAVEDDGAIIVWGWGGSTATVFHDGAQLGSLRGERPRVPLHRPAEVRSDRREGLPSD